MHSGLKSSCFTFIPTQFGTNRTSKCNSIPALYYAEISLIAKYLN